jgi:hypothetical protein
MDQKRLGQLNQFWNEELSKPPLAESVTLGKNAP